MLPIPSHLKNYFIPIGNDNDEFSVKGIIKCSCNNEKDFDLLFFNGEAAENQFFCVIKVRCNKCKSEILVFDADFHGWDGFVCHDESEASLKRPELKTWKCLNCGHTNVKINLKINSQGKDDYIEEAGEEFNEDQWIEAFEWITIDVFCNNCQKEIKEWISYETM